MFIVIETHVTIAVGYGHEISNLERIDALGRQCKLSVTIFIIVAESQESIICMQENLHKLAKRDILYCYYGK